MPRPSSEDHLNKNGASIRFEDAEGRKHSQFVRTDGGGINTNADESLAQKIADCSNAALTGYGKSESNDYLRPNFRAKDEQQSSVASVMVLVWQHKSEAMTRKVEIPAYDASLLLSDGKTPDVDNPLLAAVISQADGIINDDGNAVNPPNWFFVRAYTTTVQPSGKKRNYNQSKITVVEGDDDPENPPDAPAVSGG